MEIHIAHAQPMGILIFEGHHKPFHALYGFFLHLHGSRFMANKMDPIGNYRCQH